MLREGFLGRILRRRAGERRNGDDHDFLAGLPLEIADLRIEIANRTRAEHTGAVGDERIGRRGRGRPSGERHRAERQGSDEFGDR